MKNLLTVQEVAEELAYTKTTVYRMIQRGDLPAYKVGSEYRIQREDLERFVSSGRVGASK